MSTMRPPFLETPRLLLGSLRPEDLTEEYLAWLNDSEVLRYRAPKAFPTDIEALKEYLGRVAAREDLLLAIRLKDTGRHIGNISLNSILWVHRSAELSVMIGAKDMRGQGFGKEAIYGISKHGFESMGLHRLWAESPNPAFNRAVTTLGWKHEGTKREAFLLDGDLVDIECWGQLRTEFPQQRGFGRGVQQDGAPSRDDR